MSQYDPRAYRKYQNIKRNVEEFLLNIYMHPIHKCIRKILCNSKLHPYLIQKENIFSIKKNNNLRNGAL